MEQNREGEIQCIPLLTGRIFCQASFFGKDAAGTVFPLLEMGSALEEEKYPGKVLFSLGHFNSFLPCQGAGITSGKAAAVSLIVFNIFPVAVSTGNECGGNHSRRFSSPDQHECRSGQGQKGRRRFGDHGA